MAQEHEVLARCRDDLRRGKELCLSLKKNAIEHAPRELSYIELKTLCRRLEESCRQMAHERGDDERRMAFPWIELAHHFKKLADAVQKLRRGHRWLLFGDLAEVFERHTRNIAILANRATGNTSLSGQLLILPPWLRSKPQSSLILPG